MKLKFVSKTFFIEIEPSNHDTFWVSEQSNGIPVPREVTLEYLKKHFEPGDCDALNFIDPDRDARITGEL